MPFPIDRVNERSFDPAWSGEVFICDIDRTYLYTRFSSLKGLASIPFEFAIDKQDIEGMVPLLREVRRGPERRSRSTPLFFVSASPAQLRPVIQRKMLLDGLEFDGTIFKDWLGCVASLRFNRLKEQLGYKLTALLLQRAELPRGARQVLMGDDLEADALVFTLFADAVSGRLDAELLLRILRHHGVAYDDANDICELVGRVPPGEEQVQRAFIRMERHDNPEAFLDYWPHVGICRGAFQLALSLWDQQSISSAGVTRVAREMLEQGTEAATLDERLEEAVRRALVGRERAVALREELSTEGLLPPTSEALPGVDAVWAEASARADAWWTPRPLREV